MTSLSKKKHLMMKEGFSKRSGRIYSFSMSTSQMIGSKAILKTENNLW